MKHVEKTNKFFIYEESNKPVMSIDPGETISFSSEDCFQNLLTDCSIVKTDLLNKGITINPSSGPVYVNGAMPGDTLKVHIDDIQLDDQYGTLAIIAEEFGVLGKYFDKEETIKVDLTDGVAKFFDGKANLKIRPMVGVLAVTPKGYGAPTSTPGTYGGNMDCKLINKGTTLYLPVSVEGALLGMGDIHALQSDGEILAAVECPGTITVTVDLIKDRHEEWPVLETDDAFYVICSGDDIDEANNYALIAMAEFLGKRTEKFTQKEWIVLMGIIGDLQICEIADPKMASRFRIPKFLDENLKF